MEGYAREKDLKRTNRKLNKHIKLTKKERRTATREREKMKTNGTVIVNKVRMLSMHQDLDLDDHELVSLQQLKDPDLNIMKEVLDMKDRRAKKKLRLLFGFIHSHRKLVSIISIIAATLYFFFDVSIIDIVYMIGVGIKAFYGFF